MARQCFWGFAINKKEAAQFLDVSTRTLERLTAAGRLTKGRGKSKTRPLVVFDDTELQSLKTEFEAGRPAKVFRRLNTFDKPKDAVGFRLDPYYVKRLEEEGLKHGLSGSEYARRLVIRGLEIQTAEGDLATLRKNLSEMFFVLLVSRLGATEDEANEIVRTLSGGA